MGYGHGNHGNYQGYVHPNIPHSKSLDHYNDQNLINLNGHSRHSFDHPTCEFSQRIHDCVDGVGYGVNYRQGCAVDHPYNVSGNRYPLPATISNQLSQNDPYASDVPPPPPPPCGANVFGACTPMYTNGCIQMPGSAACCHQNMYYDCSHRGFVPNIQADLNGGYAASTCTKYYAPTQPTVAVNHRNGGARPASNADHLIDFDDKTIVPKYNNHVGGYQFDGCENSARRNESTKTKPIESSLSKQSKYAQPNAHSGDDVDCNSRRSTSSKPYFRNAELLAEYEERINNESRNSRASDFDSFDSSNNLSTDRSIASKIRDGVGSYETWDYVFQNIGKNGYNKPESNDLTVQGLDLDTLAIANPPTDKRRNRNTTEAGPSNGTNSATKKVSNETKTTSRANQNSADKLTVSSAKVNGRATSKSPTILPAKSALKSSESHQLHNRSGTLDDFVIVGNRAKTGTIKKVPNKSSTTNGDVHRPTTNGKITNETSRNSISEWPCRHCTFLNPTGKNICEMCCKSRDCMPDGLKTSTCV